MGSGGNPRGRQAPDWLHSVGARRAGAFAAGLAVLAGVALIAANIGNWTGRSTSPAEPPEYPTTVPRMTLPTIELEPAQPPPPSAPMDLNLTWLLVVAIVVVAVAALLLALRWWKNRPPRDAGSIEIEAAAQEHPVEPTRVDQPGPFDTRVAATDVIASWQWVESTARWVGLGRRPEQTPTEFLEALQQGAGADDAGSTQAGRELLSLYHRARFDHVALRPDSADIARADAAKLVDHVRAMTVLSTPTGRHG